MKKMKAKLSLIMALIILFTPFFNAAAVFATSEDFGRRHKTENIIGPLELQEDEGKPEGDAGGEKDNVLTNDVSTKDGNLKFTKSAKKVADKANTWEITLKVQAKDQIIEQPAAADIYLVMDTSGSMAGAPLEKAKAAANKFVEAFLTEKNNSLKDDEDVKIRIVSFSNNVKEGTLTKDATAVKSKINELIADGSTFTAGAINEVLSKINESDTTNTTKLTNQILLILLKESHLWLCFQMEHLQQYMNQFIIIQMKKK